MKPDSLSTHVFQLTLASCRGGGCCCGGSVRLREMLLLFLLSCLREMLMPRNTFCLIHNDVFPFYFFLSSWYSDLFFGFARASTFKVHLSQVVGLIATVEVFVIVPQFVLVLTFIVQHTILDVRAERIVATL